MSKSLLEAIKEGMWDFEPAQAQATEFAPTDALPGTIDKLSILADRMEKGLPLWHPHDRLRYDEVAAQLAQRDRQQNMGSRRELN